MKLKWGTLQTGFKYHWRTMQNDITHLCFADDFLVFCHANLDSINIVNSCINSFSLYSSLIPNGHKSQCFLASTDLVTS